MKTDKRGECSLSAELQEKLNVLENCLSDMGSAAIAFSGGVDSTLLLYIAGKVLGERAAAVTCEASFVPERESSEAKVFCEEHHIRQAHFRVSEKEVPGFMQNPPDRCYLCKKAIFSKFSRWAEKEGIRWVAEGSNMDDMGDYRPGMKAIRELGIRSPLREAGLYKSEIRILSEYFGLPTWNKPSFACLASRFVYGEQITEEKLRMVDQGEQLLLNLGFHQMRVRIHGASARIEVLPEEMEKLLLQRESIVSAFKKAGFSYVTMDLQGYRTGSMNEVL